jgi:hypothetical protein
MKKSAAISKIENANLRLQHYVMRSQDRLEVFKILLSSEQESLDNEQLFSKNNASEERIADIFDAFHWVYAHFEAKDGKEEATLLLQSLVDTPVGQFVQHLSRRYAEVFSSKGYSNVLDEIAANEDVVSIDKIEFIF